jgi:hypothetical protein
VPQEHDQDDYQQKEQKRHFCYYVTEDFFGANLIYGQIDALVELGNMAFQTHHVLQS